MPYSESEAIKFAKNLFVPSIDGAESPDLPRRVDMIATLLEAGLYDNVSVYEALRDMETEREPVNPKRLQRIARGFGEAIFPERRQPPIPPRHEDDLTDAAYEELKVAV